MPATVAADPVSARCHRWDAVVEEHRVALAAFLDTAEAVSDVAWTRPVAPGKWSPAQIVEHLALAYEAGVAELDEGRPMQVRVRGMRQRLMRWLLLPHILFHRTFPSGAPAPRETRPGGEAQPRSEALERLRDDAARVEVALDRARREGRTGHTHPYFGPIPPVRAMRLCAVHLEHHRRQIAG